MGKLDGASVYLSGAMEMAADHGVAWRRKFIELIKKNGIKIDCIDPTNKPADPNFKIGEEKEFQNQLKREGRFKELKMYVGGTKKKLGYRRLDLRYVDNVDFLVVLVDPTIAQWGTGNETYFAEMQHKPMFFICEGGLYNLPNWLFDVIDLDDEEAGTRCNVFENVEQVIEELKLYDNGSIPMSSEWVLFRKYIELNRAWQHNQEPQKPSFSQRIVSLLKKLFVIIISLSGA